MLQGQARNAQKKRCERSRERERNRANHVKETDNLQIDNSKGAPLSRYAHADDVGKVEASLG